jgi:predicted RNA methylase
MDWRTWHEDYDLPGSSLAKRLKVIQDRIVVALDDSPPGPLKVISMCAGQGRDLLGVLPDHPRRADVSARLVELDPRNAAFAEDTVRSARLGKVEVVAGDAGVIDQYSGMAPADLVIACGVFGNISDEDVQRTIRACSQLCKNGGTVIWTRHRSTPDPVPRICAWFEAQGFERKWLSEAALGFGVGVHRFAGKPQTFAHTQMFTFVSR